MALEVTPICISQLFNAGASVTGVAPNGVSSAETKLRGAWLKFTGCTDGGLISMPIRDIEGEPVEPGTTEVMRMGTSVAMQSMFYDLPGSAGVVLSMVDPDNVAFRFAATNTDYGEYNPNWPTLIMPGWRVKIVQKAVGVLTNPGYIWAFFSVFAMGQGMFTHIKQLGKEQLPPRHVGGC